VTVTGVELATVTWGPLTVMDSATTTVFHAKHHLRERGSVNGGAFATMQMCHPGRIRM